jgi:DNA-binding XRE family transcriptional regulator
MDKRLTRPVDRDLALEQRDQFYKDLAEGKMSVAAAVVAMRKLSRLTQPEFAKHRGISTQALRQIETGQGNPTVETLEKIGSVFGLEVGFVKKR